MKTLYRRTTWNKTLRQLVHSGSATLVWYCKTVRKRTSHLQFYYHLQEFCSNALCTANIDDIVP